MAEARLGCPALSLLGVLASTACGALQTQGPAAPDATTPATAATPAPTYASALIDELEGGYDVSADQIEFVGCGG